jgi:hypothetical protein
LQSSFYYFSVVVVVVAVVVRRLGLKAIATIETENASPAKCGMYDLWGKQERPVNGLRDICTLDPATTPGPPSLQGLTLLSFIHHPVRCC